MFTGHSLFMLTLSLHTPGYSILAVLRALYIYRSSVDGSSVSIFVPNKSLVKSILVPPVSNDSSVTESHHAMEQR